MDKFAVFLLIVVSLFISPGFNSKTVTFGSDSVILAKAPIPESTTVEILTLSDKEIFIPCQNVYVRAEKCPAKVTIYVATRGAIGADGEESEVKYQVSAGQIIGKGADVKWDLSEVKTPGVYTITVDFVDFNNERRTATQTITVKNCDCQYVDACPTIEISAAKQSVKAGEAIIFMAKTSDELASVSYNWTVSAGEIIEGQGTPKIKVKTMREMAESNLTALVELTSDNIPAFCETSRRAETVSITK